MNASSGVNHYDVFAMTRDRSNASPIPGAGPFTWTATRFSRRRSRVWLARLLVRRGRGRRRGSHSALRRARRCRSDALAGRLRWRRPATSPVGSAPSILHCHAIGRRSPGGVLRLGRTIALDADGAESHRGADRYIACGIGAFDHGHLDDRSDGGRCVHGCRSLRRLPQRESDKDQRLSDCGGRIADLE